MNIWSPDLLVKWTTEQTIFSVSLTFKSIWTGRIKAERERIVICFHCWDTGFVHVAVAASGMGWISGLICQGHKVLPMTKESCLKVSMVISTPCSRHCSKCSVDIPNLLIIHTFIWAVKNAGGTPAADERSFHKWDERHGVNWEWLIYAFCFS